jgi:hypothetical protein
VGGMHNGTKSGENKYWVFISYHTVYVFQIQQIAPRSN